jgi:uncharacterized membrane protein YozB (DUF420 family)
MNNLFSIAQFLNTLIFLIIAGFHFYWAFGGKFGSQAVIPKIEDKLVFKPSILATILVALAMLVGVWLSWKPKLNNHDIIFIYGNVAIGIVMLIRAVGDFKYVGFFKKIKGTFFAQNDTRYYSPLCLLISLNAFYIFFIIR